MGFEIHIVVTLPKPPTDALMIALDHVFGEAKHEVGTKTVTLTEHVSMSNEADAVGFVQALVIDAIPPGAKITEISSVSD
jgi:hypothetical protein